MVEPIFAKMYGYSNRKNVIIRLCKIQLAWYITKPLLGYVHRPEVNILLGKVSKIFTKVSFSLFHIFITSFLTVCLEILWNGRFIALCIIFFKMCSFDKSKSYSKIIIYFTNSEHAFCWVKLKFPKLKDPIEEICPPPPQYLGIHALRCRQRWLVSPSDLLQQFFTIIAFGLFQLIAI